MKNKSLLTRWLPPEIQEQNYALFRARLKTQFYFWRHQLLTWGSRYWFRLLVVSLTLFIIIQKNVSIHFAWNTPTTTTETLETPPSQFINWTAPTWTTKKKTYTAKEKRQIAYVQRFGKVAQQEMEKYGIPASITLAQGLLETNAGKSPLATENNNHFGIKCFSKTCKKGHCSNFSDDTHKDFFVRYGTVWESFRAHSKLLQRKRYRPLYKLGKKDYKAWAKGLRKAGYATDKKYAEKLIALIEAFELHRWDK